MPLYEYRCLKCEYEFEDILSVDAKNPECLECHGETEKLISHFFGIVKGSEHRLLDCVVGDDANKKWEILNKRKEKRSKIQAKE